MIMIFHNLGIRSGGLMNDIKTLGKGANINQESIFGLNMNNV